VKSPGNNSYGGRRWSGALDQMDYVRLAGHAIQNWVTRRVVGYVLSNLEGVPWVAGPVERLSPRQFEAESTN
jgi:hypothetical protein